MKYNYSHYLLLVFFMAAILAAPIFLSVKQLAAHVDNLTEQREISQRYADL